MRQKKILVIDDDEMNLQIAKVLLEKKLSCEVLTATGGIEGIEILRQERVHLVLLDIMMPDPDGIETLRRIRSDEHIKNVSVMMLTASGYIDDIQKVGTLGVKEYIKKPFLPADFVKRIGKKLSEIHSEEILLFGDDETVLTGMKTLIEENFAHEVSIATTIAAAEKILHAQEIKLIVTCADMKFIDGFKFLSLVAGDEKFNAIPFTITNAEKLLEVVEKINSPQAREDSPVVEKNFVSAPEKKKIANVVTNLIGYELDMHI